MSFKLGQKVRLDFSQVRETYHSDLRRKAQGKIAQVIGKKNYASELGGDCWDIVFEGVPHTISAKCLRRVINRNLPDWW